MLTLITSPAVRKKAGQELPIKQCPLGRKETDRQSLPQEEPESASATECIVISRQNAVNGEGPADVSC